MSLTAYERETTVNLNDADDTAQVFTAQRTVLTRLRRNPAAEEMESGVFDGTEWARFRLPAKLVSFRNPRVITEQRKAQLAASAASARAARNR
jgi:hypothetical protein